MSENTVSVEFNEKRIDALFAELDGCHLPGGAVGIAIGGKPIYRKGFGLASMEVPVALTPSTRMRIYSITKQFTCLAYLLLCEEGKVKIDDPLGNFLPELHPVTHKVTMRQLMGNVSGLRDACDIRWLLNGTERPISSPELVTQYRYIDDVNFAPGTSWSYNNGGFQLLSASIERIDRKSLENVLRERIFEPVGMHDTLLRRFDDDFVPNSASMHMTTLVGGYEKSYLAGALAGEGGMVSTVDDMLRWLAHMDAPRIGSAATWTLMKAPQRLVNGNSTGYGLGLINGHYRGVKTLWHGGGGMGANAQMLKVPAAGLDVTTMVNRQDVDAIQLTDKILDACLRGLDAVRERPVPPIAKGIFRSPTTGRIIQLCPSSSNSLWVKQGQQIASVDGFDVTVECDDKGLLRPARAFSLYKYAVTLVGDPVKPAGLRFSEFGNLDELMRLPEVENADANAIAGRYLSETTHTEAIIRNTGDTWLRTVGRFGSAEFKLDCLADGVWRARSTSSMPYGGVLAFDDKRTGFSFSWLTTRALRFRHCAVRDV